MTRHVKFQISIRGLKHHYMHLNVSNNRIKQVKKMKARARLGVLLKDLLKGNCLNHQQMRFLGT